jgi:hypothetical protein
LKSRRPAKSAFEILRYDPKRRSRSAVKKRYLTWRSERGLPTRCDNPACAFYSNTPLWNGVPLPLILDHRNGNCFDNRPENLWLLCPNCDSQLLTRGGRNRGRVANLSSGGFALRRSDGRLDYVLPVEAGHIALTGGKVALRISKRRKSSQQASNNALERPRGQ